MESVAFDLRLSQRRFMSSSPSASPTAQHRPGMAILCRCGSVMMLTAMWTSTKLASEGGAHLVETLFYRAVFALPILLLWVMAGPGLPALRTHRPRAHVQRAVIGLTSMFVTFYTIIVLPLAEATTLSFTAPIFSTILSAMLLGERIGRYRIAAILVGFIGVLIVMQSSFSSDKLPMTGLVIGLISAIGLAAVTVTVRQISETETATATVFWFTVATIVVTGMMMPWFGQRHDLHTFGFLAMTGTMGVMGQLLMTASLRFGPVSLVVPFDYSQLFWAGLLGYLVWDTVPPPATWLGTCLIVIAGLFTFFRERRPRITGQPYS